MISRFKQIEAEREDARYINESFINRIETLEKNYAVLKSYK